MRNNNENIGWDFQVRLPEKSTVVKVESVGVVRVKYEDEVEPRPLYKYVDYSNTIQIRTQENILYVHWNELLISNTDWLMAYDLNARREILRRKIDPDDLKQSH